MFHNPNDTTGTVNHVLALVPHLVRHACLGLQRRGLPPYLRASPRFCLDIRVGRSRNGPAGAIGWPRPNEHSFIKST